MHKETVTGDNIKVLERDIRNLTDQVAAPSTNMSEMMTKLLLLEDKEDCDVDNILPKHNHGTSKDCDEFKCEKCGFKCRKEATLRKRRNTKHNMNLKMRRFMKHQFVILNVHFVITSLRTLKN